MTTQADKWTKIKNWGTDPTIYENFSFIKKIDKVFDKNLIKVVSQITEMKMSVLINGFRTTNTIGKT